MISTEHGRSHAAHPATRAAGAIAITAAVVTGVPMLSHPAEAKAWDFPEGKIAEQARKHEEGAYGGQCKVFAQKVVNEVLRREGVKARVSGYGTPGGAYYGTYKRAGGTLVELDQGEPGDLIQVITPSQKNSDSPRTRDGRGESVLHTAIIVERTERPGRYIVRDSNYVSSGTVGEHSWAPGTWRKRGVEVYIWRFGKVTGADRDTPIDAGEHAPATTAPTQTPVTGSLPADIWPGPFESDFVHAVP